MLMSSAITEDAMYVVQECFEELLFAEKAC